MLFVYFTAFLTVPAIPDLTFASKCTIEFSVIPAGVDMADFTDSGVMFPSSIKPLQLRRHWAVRARAVARGIPGHVELVYSVTDVGQLC